MNPVAATVLRGVPLAAAGLIVTPLPRGLELRLGPQLGRLLLLFDPKRKPIARENIRRCLPELSPAQRKRLLRENYEHYGVLFFELLHMFSPIPGHFRRYTARHTVVEGLENWRRAQAKGRGTVIVTAHLANWEMLGQAGVEGVPCLMATQLADPVLSTEALLARVESWIREIPAQWLWVHRRFKNATWPVQIPS